MRAKFFVVLILLSAVLIGVGFYTTKRATIDEPTRTFDPAAPRDQFKRAKPATPRRNSASATKIVYVTNQFNWSQVESSDYREYITNLRAIGCPETTIKDIILTDILKLYAARRGQFYNNGRQFKFWETDEKRKLSAKQLEEREQHLAAIDKEIPSVLRELLGINYEREINKYFVDTNEEERRLNFLPEEKRAQLFALRDRTEAMKEWVLAEVNGNLSPANIEALRRIETDRQSQLEKILSRPELAEFELRTSPVADQLRAQLIGFNPSESEFRQFFELQKAMAENFTFASDEEKAAAQGEIQEEIRDQLGETRFAEYQLAQNPDYRDACVFTEAYELPTSTAQTIFEIKQIAEAEKKNLLVNPAISESQKWEALTAIQRETEKSLRQTMSAKVFAKYTQSTGGWIEKLGTPK